MQVMDATWTLLWLLVCLTILVLIVESIYRRMKERKLAQQELDIQRQIQDQPYHIYTLQPLSNSMHTNPVTTVLSQQQQQYIRQQQELKAYNDLPPKYEDVVKDPNSYKIPISSNSSSSMYGNVTSSTATFDINSSRVSSIQISEIFGNRIQAHNPI